MLRSWSATNTNNVIGLTSEFGKGSGITQLLWLSTIFLKRNFFLKLSDYAKYSNFLFFLIFQRRENLSTFFITIAPKSKSNTK